MSKNFIINDVIPLLDIFLLGVILETKKNNGRLLTLKKYTGITWSTCKTSKIEAIIARHIIPSVTMLCTKSVYAVLVVPIIWLLMRPESKFANFFICPNKWSFHTPIIESNPGSLSVMSMLNVHIFFLVVYSHQLWTHRRAVRLSSKPWHACGTCEVAVPVEVTPTWLAYIWVKDRIYTRQAVCVKQPYELSCLIITQSKKPTNQKIKQ